MIRKYRLWTSVLSTAVLLLIPQGSVAENANPFGTGDAPPAQNEGGFFEEGDLDKQNNLGFGAPQDLGVPPPSDIPVPNSPPSIPPPNLNRGSVPPPVGRTASPSPTIPTTRARSAQKAPVPSSSNTPLSKTGKAAASRLADYLQLDSSVKGLEVKNFDLPDKEIRDVVTLISKWTGKNFIIDSKVRGKITILGPSQVTLEEAYQAFLSALEANGLTTVKSNKFIRIIESAEARRAPVETYSGDYTPDTDQFITRIFQLKYINADEVQREFRDLTTRQGKLFAYEPTNSIIITDTGSNIKRIQGILDTLDVKGFETTLHVLRIKNSSSKSIAEMLAEIYGDDRSGGANRTRTFRRSALERTRGGGIISKIIPDEQTNSLLVLANRAGFDQLIELVRRLDVRVSDTGRIHVYYCEYAKAEDLAATLASLAGGGGAGLGKQTNRKASVTGGTNLGGAPGATGNSPVSTGPVTAELDGGAKITSDAATNSLVITANSGDYQTLKRVIKKLDIPRLQVFVETAILEVNIDRDTTYGVNLGTSAPGRPFAGGFIGDPAGLSALLTNGLPAPGISIPLVSPPSFTNSITVGGASTSITTYSFMGLLRLLTSKTNSSVLSTPQIIALDNEKAEFKVLDETPVQSTFVASVGGTAGGIGNVGQGSIENKKTGIEITLTPHVNAASKSIRMEIAQKIDSIRNSGVPDSLKGVQIATTSRVTNTTVVVKDQDFVMLGGLMSDKVDETVRKVPLLGDIPILGWLFKAKEYKSVKSNLIILLRPRIIGTSISAAEIIDDSLQKRAEFVEDNLGGDDPHEKRSGKIRDDVKRQKNNPVSDPFDKYRNNAKDEEEERPTAQTAEEILPDPQKGKARNSAKKAPEAPAETDPMPELAPPPLMEAEPAPVTSENGAGE